MATLRSTSSSCTRTTTRQVAGPSRARCVVVKAQQDARQEVSRRSVMGAVALSVAGLVSSAAPAQAFLGFGEDNLATTYTTATGNLLAEVKSVLELPRDDDSKEEKVKNLRKDINSWVAAYRREPKLSGRPSYGNTYSVVNALSGHYNSFGATAPIPKKRLERIEKELADANLFLARNR